MKVLGNSRPPSESERGGQSGDGSEAEGGEGEQESEEDGRLGLCGEPAKNPRRDDERLCGEPAEETADGHEKEDAEGCEREGGRLQLHARQDRGRDIRTRQRGSTNGAAAC